MGKRGKDGVGGGESGIPRCFAPCFEGKEGIRRWWGGVGGGVTLEMSCVKFCGVKRDLEMDFPLGLSVASGWGHYQKCITLLSLLL